MRHQGPGAGKAPFAPAVSVTVASCCKRVASARARTTGLRFRVFLPDVFAVVLSGGAAQVRADAGFATSYMGLSEL